MEHIKLLEGVPRFRSGSAVWDFQSHDPDIDGAVVAILGRYPAEGTAFNEVCKMSILVVMGQGGITVEGDFHHVEKNDLLIIPPRKHYFWEGNLRLFVASTPRWNPKQHKHLVPSPEGPR